MNNCTAVDKYLALLLGTVALPSLCCTTISSCLTLGVVTAPPCIAATPMEEGNEYEDIGDDFESIAAAPPSPDA